MNELERMIYEANCEDKSKLERIKYRISLLFRKYNEKLKETGAIISGKRYKTDKQYVGAPRVNQETVERNPEKYIIKECIPACKILWSKNIYTFMCSDQLDENAWIEFEIDTLSEENKEVLEELKKEYKFVNYHEGCVYIAVNGKGKKALLELINIASRFRMQDVPKKYATISIEEALMSLGYTNTIKNPEYIEDKDKFFEEHPEIKEYERFTFMYANQDMFFTPNIKVLATERVPEDPNTCLEGTKFIVDEERKIYRNLYHYKKHLNYLETLVNKDKKTM